MRRRSAVPRRFRDAFYRKQQLKAFHGKFKEKVFRKNFQKYLSSGANRNRSFFASLERRLDVFFFRMRLLPTIFACNQYILQHGLLVNDGVNCSPNTILRVGDIVSLNRKH
jgi:ribosomal protein S4